jgi:hypothetical protein|tara:strand:- start:489 stop:752 length:264 start_codon:yes stop_codon:yes gene_type:complete
MKFFIYKSLIIFFLALILFKFTIGNVVTNYEEKIGTYFSEENLILIKQKAREEMQNAINKENYLKPEDAELINKFLKKIQGEIFNQQ